MAKSATAKKELYTLDDCEVKDRPTGKAMEVKKNGNVYMIPISHIQLIHAGNRAITMTAWIAKQKGII